MFEISLCVTQIIKMFPAVSAADGSCAKQYYSQDCFIEDLREIKEEPKDVCYCLYTVCTPKNDILFLLCVD